MCNSEYTCSIHKNTTHVLLMWQFKTISTFLLYCPFLLVRGQFALEEGRKPIHPELVKYHSPR